MKLATLVTIALSTAAVMLTMTYLHRNSAPQPIDSAQFKAFASFKTEYKKSYGSVGEARFRFEIFKMNLALIQEHKAKKDQSYTLDVNQFADLSYEEFKSKYLMRDFQAMKKVSEDNCGDAEETQGNLGLEMFGK